MASRSPQPPRPLQLASRLALLAASLLACFAVAELAVRAIHGDRYARRPSFLEPHPQLGWRPQPDLDHTFYGRDFQTAIATDAEGHRLGARGAWDDAEALIVVAGDSYTFGWGVSTPDTWASRLDERAAQASGGRVRVVNLGVGGYGTTQTTLRVSGFLHGTRMPPPLAVVMLHSHNDFSDDVSFLSVRAGLRELAPVPPNGSRFHVVTFVRQALRRWREGEGPRAFRDGRRRDQLFHVSLRDRAEMQGREAVVAVGRLRAPQQALFDERETQPATLARGALSELQAALLAESLERLHGAAYGRAEVLFLHAVIHSAPDWYVETLREAVAASAAATGRRVRFAGRVPAREEFHGRFENDHSGLHFTPELNAYYAERIAGWLRTEGIF